MVELLLLDDNSRQSSRTAELWALICYCLSLFPVTLTRHYLSQWQSTTQTSYTQDPAWLQPRRPTTSNYRVIIVNINFLRSFLFTIGRKHKPHRSQKGSKPGRKRHPIGRFFNMGNEESTPIDESVPPVRLTSRTINAVADYIKSGAADKIVVMTGAGISTSAGIPDFRSPETGLYANLARLNLPYAEAVFDISYFREKPEPFYTLAHELYPGKYRPTVTHSFLKLLHDKGLLLKLFTQNIDCLEREAGVPDDKIIEAHGSFARQSCIECKTPYAAEEMKKHIDEKTIPRCHTCQGLVKPEIVFFGEQLPAEFFQARGLPAEANLAIVIGTSLTVQPFASLPGLVQDDTPRILLNKERVGDLGSRPDDVVILGACDDGVRQLCDALGWREELEALWAQTAPKAASELGKEKEKKTKDEELEDEVDKLTKEVDETLNLSKWHEEKVRNEKLPRDASEKVGSSVTKAVKEEKDSLGHVFVGGLRIDSVTPTEGAKSEEGTTKGEEDKDGSKL